MTGVRAVEGGEPHVRARFDDGVRLGVQIERAILAIARSKLLARYRKGTVLAVPDEDGAARCTDEDF